MKDMIKDMCYGLACLLLLGGIIIGCCASVGAGAGMIIKSFCWVFGC